MGRNDYINYNRRYRSRKNRQNTKMLARILLVLLIASAAGVSAFFLTRGNLGAGPGMNGYTGSSPTPTPEPTRFVVITNTPEPTPEPTHPPVLGGKDYLVGYVDTRKAVDAKAVYAPKIYEDARLKQILDLAAASELNAVVIDVRDDYGRITYNMEYGPAKEIGATSNIISDMPKLLKTLHDNGVYVIARVVCFRELIMNGEQQSITQKSHPDWYCTSKKVNADNTITHYPDKAYTSTENGGRTAVWMNPYQDAALEYLVGVAAQAVKDGFDEVCFDYFRCTTRYVSTCDFGLPDSDYVPRTESNWGFPRTITQRIATFSKYACNVIKPLGGFVSGTLESMVVCSTIDETAQGQNYQILSQYFDYLCPTIYAYGYGKGFGGIENPNREPEKIVEFIMKKSVGRLITMPTRSETGHVAKVRPWLQASTVEWVDKEFVYTPDVIKSQFPPCELYNTSGWMLWNDNNSYSDEIFTKK